VLQKTWETSVPVDLIRTVAVVLVIVVHAAIEPHPVVQVMDQAEVVRWFTVNSYDALAASSVPLFVMLSGALLLQPSKVEPIRVFLKKRALRLGLPFIFWGTAYFAWRFFVNHEALSASSIVQGILTGPYYHFWFLYMLFGLYLITPVLRVVTTYAERKISRYFLLLCFFGTAIVPVIILLSGFSVELNLFAVTGWIGYFLLGYYLLETRVRSSTLYIFWLTGFLLTIVGTYAVTALVGGHSGLFFLDYLSASVILASASLFMVLLKVSPSALETRFPRGSRLIHFTGCSTLSIYLLHVMVLESLQKGYFGFQISVNTMNPIVEIPLITIVTLFVSLGIVFLLKRIPVVKKIIG
jgi:surface polysaccharide O-acyltransferase-like enzyme